jgi:hypothetical protein
VRLEELGQLKNPITSSGIKPATFPACSIDMFLRTLTYFASLLSSQKKRETLEGKVERQVKGNSWGI